MTETPRADFWFALLLVALGLAITVESWRMPRLDHLGVHPMSAPGLTPGLLGVVLAVLGLLLLLRSARAGAGAVQAGAKDGWGRFAVVLALCLGFAVVLLGRVPFWAATALFVFTFVMVFTWRRRPPVRVGLYAAGLALAVAVAVTLLFEQVFLVRLP